MSLREKLAERLILIHSMTPQEREVFLRNHPCAHLIRPVQRKVIRQKIEQRKKTKLIIAAFFSFSLSLTVVLLTSYLYLN